MTDSSTTRRILSILAIGILVGVPIWLFLLQEEPDPELEQTEIRTEGNAGVRRDTRSGNKERTQERVTGRIVSETGRLLQASLNLVVLPPPGAQREAEATLEYEGRTDAAGRFQFSVPGYAVVELRVRPDTGCPLTFRALKLPGEDLEFGDLRIPGGAIVSGTVTDSEGEPVSGARILVGPRARKPGGDGAGFFLVGINDALASEAKSDDDGRFRVAGVPPGGVAVIVTAPGFQPFAMASLKATLDRETDVELTIQRALSLEISLRDEKSADLVGNARIELSALDYHPGDQVLQSFHNAVYELDGARPLTVTGLADRRYRIRATAEGYLASPDVIVPATAAVTEVKMRPSAVVWGRVTDQDSGASVAATVRCSHASARSRGTSFKVLESGEAARRLETSESPGLFALVDGASSSVRVAFAAPGYASGSVLVEDLESGELRALKVSMQREAVVRGVVLSHTLQPLAGATVIAVLERDTAAEDDAAELSLMNGRVDQLDPRNGAVRFRPEGRVTVVTEEDGSFVLRGLAHGRYRLSASHEEQLSAPWSEYAVNPQGVLDDVEIQLLPAGGVQGTVTGADGRPVAGATISVRTIPPQGASGSLADLALTEEVKAGYADHAGAFRLSGIKPGSYLLLVTTPDLPGAGGAGAAQRRIRIRAGRDLTQELRLVSGR